MAAASTKSLPNAGLQLQERDMSRRAHKPDPAQRRQVEALAAYGIPEADVSRILGVDPKTLRKHYREELDLGETKANAQVAGFLFNSAKNGNVAAQIFWLKTRARWREVPSEHLHSGVIGTCDLNQLTDEVLERMVASARGEMRLIPKPKKTEEPLVEHSVSNGSSS
jgi:hypothetical protein